MAYKRQVTKMILISGDSDFVSAAKLARREGIDFVLNPMGNHIHRELNEHIDGLASPKFDPDRKKEEKIALKFSSVRSACGCDQQEEQETDS